MNLKNMIIFLSILCSITTYAQKDSKGLKSNIIPEVLLAAENYDFEGIVKLSNCSGAIIKFNGSSLSENALVLTNGHCIGGRFLRPGEIVYKKKLSRRMKVADKNMKFHRIRAIELIYGTMTDTDSAIYRLKETYNDLLKLDIRAFELSNLRPIEGTEIEIASGYWERGYKCSIDGFVHQLNEASWKFVDSIRYASSGCNTIGGTSGSPIVESGTRLVVGINNTANESGRKCTMNNPCEVSRDGEISARKGTSYGQQTYTFYSCLNDNNEIDLDLEGCLLPKSK